MILRARSTSRLSEHSVRGYTHCGIRVGWKRGVQSAEYGKCTLLAEPPSPYPAENVGRGRLGRMKVALQAGCGK